MPSVTLNGVTAGDLEPVVLKSFTGLGQQARTNRVESAQGGSVPLGPDVATGRDLVFVIGISDPSPTVAESWVNQLVAAWSPSDTVELTLTLVATPRVRRGRPTGIDVDVSNLPNGLAEARCTFDAFDPVWYSSTVKSVSVAVPVGGDGIVVTSGGITVASGGITVIGGATSGDGSAINAGTADADWTALLTGPLTNPRLTVNGKIVVTTIDLPAGSTAVLDSRKKSIAVDGVPVVGIAFESQWSKIPANSIPASVSLRADAGTGTALVSWRDGND